MFIVNEYFIFSIFKFAPKTLILEGVLLLNDLLIFLIFLAIISDKKKRMKISKKINKISKNKLSCQVNNYNLKFILNQLKQYFEFKSQKILS